MNWIIFFFAPMYKKLIKEIVYIFSFSTWLAQWDFHWRHYRQFWGHKVNVLLWKITTTHTEKRLVMVRGLMKTEKLLYSQSFALNWNEEVMVEVNRISFTAVSLRFSNRRTFVAKDIFSYLIRLCWLLLVFLFSEHIYLYRIFLMIIKKWKCWKR